MTNQIITKSAEASFIERLDVLSNKSQSKSVSVAGGIIRLMYYESILQDSVRATVTFVDSGNTIDNKTALEGLPIVGQERTYVKFKDNNDNTLDLVMYVNKVTPLSDDTTKSMVQLDLTSKEFIMNEKVRLNTRFDGKISDHIQKILTDQSYLGTKKKLDIEETENNYNFIGNNRRPFYAILWLAKKSVPKTQKAKGNSAGFFFFETSDGFKFKSIEGLLSENDPSGAKKEYKSFVNNQTPDGRGSTIPVGYSGKILEHNVDTATGNVQSKLEIGTYSTRTILFDPFTCYYEVITPNASADSGKPGAESNLQKAGKELPKYNKEFNRTEANKDFSRTQYMLIDKGSLPTGDSQQQIQKSKEENFDPKNILNQSVMRYNQFFSTQVTITITADFSLHAGDLIFVDSPELSNKDTQDFNEKFGGFYTIAELCHYISLSDGGYTKLTLVRDSLGKKGTPNYNAI